MPTSTFSVFFDDPFWVGVLELECPDGLRAARHVFGSEPSGPDLRDFVRFEFDRLLEQAMSAPPVPPEQRERRRVKNPKRLAREAAKAQRRPTPSTAAQEAMRMEFEARKAVHEADRRTDQRLHADERRALRIRKRKQRHRGH